MNYTERSLTPPHFDSYLYEPHILNLIEVISNMHAH